MFVMDDLTRRAIVEAVNRYGLTRCYEEDLHRGSSLYCYWVNNNFFQSDAYGVLMTVENKYGAHGVLGRPRDHFSQTVVERTEEKMFDWGFRGGRVLYIVDPLSFEIDSYLDKHDIPSKEEEHTKAMEESHHKHGQLLNEDVGDKYELTDETMELNGHTLHRIRALKDFDDVKEGDIGGWVESEDNLSQEDKCWIGGNAKAWDNASVFGDAQVYDYARVYGNAKVYDNAEVFEDAEVYGNANVHGNAKVFGGAEVHGNAKVFGNAFVYHSAEVYEDAQVFGDAKVFDCSVVDGSAMVYEHAEIYGDVLIFDNAKVYGEAKVYEKAMVEGNARVFENAKVFGNVMVYGNAKVYGEANVYEKAFIFNNANVCGNAKVFGEAEVSDKAYVCDNAEVYGEAKICDNSRIYGSAKVYGNARVYDNAKVGGDALVYGNSYVFENAEVFGEAEVYGDAVIGEYAKVDYYADEGYIMESRRRHGRMLKENKEKNGSPKCYKYQLGSSLNRQNELYSYANSLKKKLLDWASRNGVVISNIWTDSDSDDYYVIVFFISTFTGFEEKIREFLKNEKEVAPYWVSYGISGLH